MNPPPITERPPLTDEERAAFFPATNHPSGQATVRMYERSES